MDSFDVVLGGKIVDLTYDPENLTNIFAAQLDSGVVYSSNSGDSLSWNMLPIKGLDSINQDNLKLDFANEELYVAESRSKNSNVWIYSALAPYDEFLTLNPPTTLEGAIAGIAGEQLGPFPGHQSYKHFSFMVNVEDGRSVIYQGGDRNKKLRTLLFSSTGQGKSSGRIFRGVRNSSSVEWLPIVGAATHGTAPHADSRYLIFDAADNLLEADDGGIYRLTGNIDSYKWQSIIGDLRITELYSVAWDSRTQSIVAGAQDVGSLEQITPAFSEDSIKRWKAARLYSILGKDLGDLIGSTSNLESDGGIVAVANQDSFSIRYGMGNGLQTFVSRKYWNEIDPINVGSNFYLFNYGCLGLFCALHLADTINTQGFRLIRYEVNRADPTRFVIGGRATYEFFNDGTEMDVIDTSRLGRNAASIAYGAPTHPDLLYVAKDNEISQRHTPGAHWIRKVFNAPDNTGIKDIAIDPNSADNLYFITKNRVLRYNDFSSGDAAIDTLTGNLPTAFQDYDLDLYTLVVFKVNIKDQERMVLLVGGYGGVFYTTPRQDGQTSQLWLKYGEGLPNVIITDLHYNAQDDVLIAGSWGRGAWLIPDVSLNLPEVVIK